jgi:HSP20 family protein
MLVKRTPYFPSILDDILGDLAINTSNGSKFTYPAVNINETEKEYKISLAVPGLDKKDFNIDVNDNVLTVSVERNVEKEDKNDNFISKEYNYQMFSRSFNLPSETVNDEKIKASYKNGELIIELPKKEIVVEKPKLIEVK